MSNKPICTNLREFHEKCGKGHMNRTSPCLQDASSSLAFRGRIDMGSLEICHRDHRHV